MNLDNKNVQNISLNKDTIVPSMNESDIQENVIRETMPELLDILLSDRTTNKNIIWATDDYYVPGTKKFEAKAQIKPELITGEFANIIKPRALKTAYEQKGRTKAKAEVFTPTWVVKKQNDAVDESFTNDDLETYVKRTWMEITCGEAPYMASRYDMDTGESISLKDRVGFVDRKLHRINTEVEDKAEWQRLVESAYKSSYGFEWSGDSLLLARENLLYTYRDYYFDKWQTEPTYGLLTEIAKIISYNVFQMDGLKYVIPMSASYEKNYTGMDIFTGKETFEVIESKGKRVKIMNWITNKMEFFDKGIV